MTLFILSLFLKAVEKGTFFLLQINRINTLVAVLFPDIFRCNLPHGCKTRRSNQIVFSVLIYIDFHFASFKMDVNELFLFDFIIFNIIAVTDIISIHTGDIITAAMLYTMVKRKRQSAVFFIFNNNKAVIAFIFF